MKTDLALPSCRAVLLFPLVQGILGHLAHLEGDLTGKYKQQQSAPN